MKKIIGVGVVLQTPHSTFLFQERDHNTTLNPGLIVAFGGRIEGTESSEECAIREMYEELTLVLEPDQLKSLGDFESHHTPNIYVRMFLSRNIDPTSLMLHEGKSIQELSLEEALHHEKVTDFTKKVLRSLSNLA